jgi:hypothetical protein
MVFFGQVSDGAVAARSSRTRAATFAGRSKPAPGAVNDFGALVALVQPRRSSKIVRAQNSKVRWSDQRDENRAIASQLRVQSLTVYAFVRRPPEASWARSPRAP